MFQTIKPSKLALIIITSLTLSACSLFNKEQAALQVTSSDQASVYLNGNLVGQTPYYDDKLKPGEYDLRLTVDGDSTKDWQNRINLTPNIITVVNRTFGPSSDQSSHYILQMEPLGEDGSRMSIITIPDNVIVNVDNQPKGFSPLTVDTISPGDHTVTLNTPGYQDMEIAAQARAGYQLNISAQLAKSAGITTGAEDATPSAELEEDSEDEEGSEEEEAATPTPRPTQEPRSENATSSADIERPYVTITATGTGWLRVRSAPTSAEDNEVARVDVGDSFPYLDSQSGWYQIEYEPGEEGWISGQYAQLYQ